jgi:hypothetical protein
MIHFATPTKPTPINSQTVRFISYGLGLWAALLAVTQMVSFEDFVEGLRQYKLGGESTTLVIAVGMIGLEIFAVPFLLRLSLSRAARFVSALCAMLLPYAWAILTLHAFLINATVDNAAYFGGFLEFGVGGLAVTLDIAWMIVVGLSFQAIGGTKVIKPKA